MFVNKENVWGGGEGKYKKLLAIYIQKRELEKWKRRFYFHLYLLYTFKITLCFYSHPYMTTGKTIALTRRTFVGKVMSLLLSTDKYDVLSSK